MNRAARTQSGLAKERKAMQEQQRNALLDSIPKDLNRGWVDPLPDANERHIAQELRGIGRARVRKARAADDIFFGAHISLRLSCSTFSSLMQA